VQESVDGITKTPEVLLRQRVVDSANPNRSRSAALGQEEIVRLISEPRYVDTVGDDARALSHARCLALRGFRYVNDSVGSRGNVGVLLMSCDDHANSQSEAADALLIREGRMEVILGHVQNVVIALEYDSVEVARRPEDASNEGLVVGHSQAVTVADDHVDVVVATPQSAG